MLDAGCGTGLAGQALRDAGFAGRLLGVDLSPDSVALAAGRGIYDDVAVGDLQQPLEYDDDSVDGVVCVGVLTYVPDVAAIWGEFCRITRPGGAIVLTQRDDLWRERRCNDVLHDLERDGRWAVSTSARRRATSPATPTSATRSSCATWRPASLR